MAFQERTTGRRTEHPYLIAGLVTAGAVWLVSAVDATIYARNSVDKQRRVAFIVAPATSGGLVAQVSLSR
jgi:hypothetical protein